MQIAIVLYPGYTALDAIGPYELLRGLPNADVRFVNHQPGPVVADSSVLAIAATHSLAETLTPDIILVPGGSNGTLQAMADKALLNWIANCHKTTLHTVSVCSGALILAAAGLLDGKPATTHWMVQDNLKQLGALPQREARIVKTGKIYTSAGVSAGIDLALKIIDDLQGQEYAEAIQLQIEYDPQPHLDAGHPTKATPAVRKLAISQMKSDADTVTALAAIYRVGWQQIIRRIRKKTGGST